MADNVLLSIRDLSVHYITRDMGTCKAVNHLSIDISEGETLGLLAYWGFYRALPERS